MRHFCLYVIFLFAWLSFNVSAQTRQSLEQQRKKALQEIEELNGYLNDTQKDQKKSLEKLNLLNRQIDQYNRLIGTMDSEVKYVERQISETNTEIGQMSKTVERLKSEYAELIYQAYKNRGKYNKLIYVLSSKDFNEAYRRLQYFQQYDEYSQKQVEEITQAQVRLAEKTKELAVQKTEKEQLLESQKKETKQLENVKKDQNQTVNNLKSRERELRKQIADQQKKAQKLQREIEKIIAEETKKLKGSSPTKNVYDQLTPEERVLSNNFRDNRGKLPWPTEKGTITGFFGTNPHPLYKDIKINNNGVDITTIGGSSVRVVFDGTVSKVVAIPGENLAVLIRHGNYMTVYQNLINVSVKQGDRVKTKGAIGEVYTAKESKTAVVHFEIWEETKVLDPEKWISK